MNRFVATAVISTLAVASASQAAVYVGSGGSIPDATTNVTAPGVASFSVNVPDSFAIGTGNSLSLSFGRGPSGTTVAAGNREHTFIGDMDITLTPPGGSPIQIMQRLGATLTTSFGRGDDLNGTYVFADTGAVLSSTSPAAVAFGTNGASDTTGANIPQGTYRAFSNVFSGAAGTTNPVVNMDAALASANTLGLWTLTIRDINVGDVGDITSWSLTLNAIPEPVTLSVVAAGGALLLKRRRRA
jgi:hypothetical protein